MQKFSILYFLLQQHTARISSKSFLISEGPSFFSAEGGGLFSAIYW